MIAQSNSPYQYLAWHWFKNDRDEHSASLSRSDAQSEWPDIRSAESLSFNGLRQVVAEEMFLWRKFVYE
jgi:hypothetical protein